MSLYKLHKKQTKKQANKQTNKQTEKQKKVDGLSRIYRFSRLTLARQINVHSCMCNETVERFIGHIAVIFKY